MEEVKLVYICHPFTTHGNSDENYAAQERILQLYTKECIGDDSTHKLIPVSPILTFGKVIPHDADSYDIAMAACFKLLKACDIMHVWGEWEKSKGCKLEIEYCTQAGIPVWYSGEKPQP